jgi:type II secretory pathway component GspD/PulD (secretin)
LAYIDTSSPSGVREVQDMHTFVRKTLLTAFLGFICLLGNLSFAEIAVIKVEFRTASQILPLVKTMLSPEGRAGVDTQTNSIIISDSAESVKRIREFLSDLDKPVEQVKIRVRFQEEVLSKERGLSVKGKVSDDGWSASVGGKSRDGASISARDRRVNQGQTGEFSVTVLSGSAAYIRVGKKVPYTERWVYLCRRYAHFAESVVIRQIETGMEVSPVVTGDHAHIDVVPRISYEEAGKKGIVRFSEAATRLFVPRGEWVSIGGMDKEANEVIRDILSSRSSATRSTFSLWLMVEP